MLSKLAVSATGRAAFSWEMRWLSKSGHGDTSRMLSELGERQRPLHRLG